MYVKRISIEMIVTTTKDPCTPIDGFFFIWTSMTRLDASTKEAWQDQAKKANMKKRWDEATMIV